MKFNSNKNHATGSRRPDSSYTRLSWNVDAVSAFCGLRCHRDFTHTTATNTGQTNSEKTKKSPVNKRQPATGTDGGVIIPGRQRRYGTHYGRVRRTGRESSECVVSNRDGHKKLMLIITSVSTRCEPCGAHTAGAVRLLLD